MCLRLALLIKPSATQYQCSIVSNPSFSVPCSCAVFASVGQHYFLCNLSCQIFFIFEEKSTTYNKRWGEEWLFPTWEYSEVVRPLFCPISMFCFCCGLLAWNLERLKNFFQLFLSEYLYLILAYTGSQCCKKGLVNSVCAPQSLGVGVVSVIWGCHIPISPSSLTSVMFCMRTWGGNNARFPALNQVCSLKHSTVT